MSGHGRLRLSEDGAAAQALGVAVLGSTMSGYTGGPVPMRPTCIWCPPCAGPAASSWPRGGITAALAARALAAGADAVVTGSAITRTEHVTGWFVSAMAEAQAAPAAIDGAAKRTLAVDLGGTKLLVALVEGTRVLDRVEAATDRDAGPTAWVAQMADLAAAGTASSIARASR